MYSNTFGIKRLFSALIISLAVGISLCPNKATLNIFSLETLFLRVLRNLVLETSVIGGLNPVPANSDIDGSLIGGLTTVTAGSTTLLLFNRGIEPVGLCNLILGTSVIGGLNPVPGDLTTFTTGSFTLLLNRDRELFGLLLTPLSNLLKTLWKPRVLPNPFAFLVASQFQRRRCSLRLRLALDVCVFAIELLRFTGDLGFTGNL